MSDVLKIYWDKFKNSLPKTTTISKDELNRRWRQFLQTEVPTKLPSEYIASYQTIMYELTHLNDRIKQIEAWMNDYANPKIKEHIDKIKSIFSEIKNNILPMVKRAQAWANNALVRAQEAFDRAQAFIDVLRKSSSQLVNDGKNILDQASNLSRVYIIESQRIVNAYINYGKRVGAEINNVYSKAKRVGAEMKEAKDQIEPALDKAQSNIRQAYKHYRDFKDGYDLRDARRCFDDAIDAVEYLCYKGTGGQDSVVDEVSEAFKEIGNAMLALANAYARYSTVTYNETRKLGENIRVSFGNISKATSNFGHSIMNLAVNLSNNLKV